MQLFTFEFEIGERRGPFHIQFTHVPESPEDARIFAAKVIEHVRQAGFQFDDKTLSMMTESLEDCLIKIWAAEKVRKSVRSRLGKSLNRISDRLAKIERSQLDV